MSEYKKVYKMAVRIGMGLVVGKSLGKTIATATDTVIGVTLTCTGRALVTFLEKYNPAFDTSEYRKIFKMGEKPEARNNEPDE